MADYCVAYNTRTGTTKDIAGHIAEYLSTHNVACEIKDLGDLTNPEEYRGIILGTPINGMNVTPAFTESVSALGDRLPPVLGVFASSITYRHGRKNWVSAIDAKIRAAAAEA